VIPHAVGSDVVSRLWNIIVQSLQREAACNRKEISFPNFFPGKRESRQDAVEITTRHLATANSDLNKRDKTSLFPEDDDDSKHRPLYRTPFTSMAAASAAFLTARTRLTAAANAFNQKRPSLVPRQCDWRSHWRRGLHPVSWSDSTGDDPASGHLAQRRSVILVGALHYYRKPPRRFPIPKYLVILNFAICPGYRALVFTSSHNVLSIPPQPGGNSFPAPEEQLGCRPGCTEVGDAVPARPTHFFFPFIRASVMAAS